MENSKDPTSDVGGTEGRGESKTVKNSQDATIAPSHFMTASILELKPELMSPNLGTLRMAMEAIKMRLQLAPTGRIQEAIDAGLVPLFVELSSHPNKNIRLLSLWSLGTLSCGNHSQALAVVENGALQVFKLRLEDGTKIEKERAVWGIGAIAATSVVLRDICLESGVMPLLLEILTGRSLTNKRLAAWAIMNLCRGETEPNRDDVRSCIPAVVECVKNETDPELLIDALECLCYLSCHGDERETEVFETGVAPHLLAKIREVDHPGILLSALKVLGNLSSGPNHHLDYLIAQGFIDDLARLMKHKTTMKEAYWTVSNILDGTDEQAIAANVLLPTILEFIITPTDKDTLDEALWCLNNALLDCSNESLQRLLSYQPQKAIFAFLESPESRSANENIVSLWDSIQKVASELFDEDQLAKFNELLANR